MPETNLQSGASDLKAGFAWYLLVILLVANVLSFVDRQILSLLIEPIRRDLNVSDTQMGLLHGFAFSALYSVLGMPLGLYVDRHNRKILVALGITLWSLMTMACGMAQSYQALFLARIGVGIGEATLAPAAYSMLSDAFSGRRRGAVLGTYTSGTYLGIGASIAIGGAVLTFLRGAESVTLPLFGAVRTWQAALLVIGAPGLLVALAMLAVREPHRRGEPRPPSASPGCTDPGPTWGEALMYLKRHLGAFGFHFLGYACLALAAYGLGSWIPTLFIRSHGWKASEVGIRYGLMLTLFGTLGGILSGMIGDRWLRVRGRADARVLLTTFVLIPWIPLICVGVLVGDAKWALVCLGLASFFSSMANCLGPTTLHDMVPSRLRGRATALFFLVINLLGLGIGPTAVALVTDRVFGDDSALRYSILVVALPAIALGAILLQWARPHYRVACIHATRRSDEFDLKR